jgi:hypothetical protein
MYCLLKQFLCEFNFPQPKDIILSPQELPIEMFFILEVYFPRAVPNAILPRDYRSAATSFPLWVPFFNPSSSSAALHLRDVTCTIAIAVLPFPLICLVYGSLLLVIAASFRVHKQPVNVASV